MSVFLAHENVKNVEHPFCSSIAKMLMTLMKDKLILFTNNTLPSTLPSPASIWREEKMSCGVPEGHPLTTEIFAIPF